MVQITYIFMVMRNKIVLDQLPHRAARLKVLPFASFTILYLHPGWSGRWRMMCEASPPPLHGSGAPAQSAAHRDIAAECRGSVRIELYHLHSERCLQLLLA